MAERIVDREKLIEDMRYLRSWYGWTDEDVQSIKAEAKEHPELWTYWMRLAAAYRKGKAWE